MDHMPPPNSHNEVDPGDGGIFEFVYWAVLIYCLIAVLGGCG